MTMKERLRIIAATLERNRHRDAEFAQKQKEAQKGKEGKNADQVNDKQRTGIKAVR